KAISPLSRFKNPIRVFRVIRGSNSGLRSLNLWMLVGGCWMLLCTGCQVLSYTSPTGERFTRSSLGANTSIHSLTVESGTNGIRKVHVNGYENNTTDALGAVTEAAVKAALTAAKP